MSDERDALGRFENNLHVGTVSEQARAGVTVSDTEWSAAAKVGHQRVQEAVAHAARMGDPFYAEAMSRVLERDRKARWMSLILLPIVAAVAWLWVISEVDPRRIDPTVPFVLRHVPSSLGVRGMTGDYVSQAQDRARQHARYLFRPEAPLERLLDGCAAKPCMVPDVVALEAFKTWAADAQTPWDQQMCGYFLTLGRWLPPGTPLTHLGVTPVWRMDRKLEACRMSNFGEIRSRANWLNGLRTAAAAVVIIAAMVVIRRRINRLP